MDVIRLGLTATLIFALAPAATFSQVNKFKSQSRFNPGSTDKNTGGSNFTDDKNNQAAFGNRTDKIPELPSSKYVQLNPETAFGPEVVQNFDFPDTDILELTKHMQELTGINLILDKDVKGKVSISAPTPITVGDAWKAYLAALNMAGYTLVKAGAFYKIINARDVRYVPTKIYTGSYTPDTEAHIMKVMTLRHVDAAEISRNFRPFMSRYGRIIDLKQTNTVIISDTGSNIARLVTLIKFLDVPGFEETLQIIKVENSSASEIAKLLDEILKGGGSGGGAARRGRPSTGASSRFTTSSGAGGTQNISKIIAEPRTNSIIAMANADGARELRELINKLDVKYGSTNSDKIHVHYLNYGSSEELAKTLSSLVSGSGATGAPTAGGARNFSRGGGADDGSTLFNGEVKINADKNNNALVVTASPTDWITIKSVINKLDIPRDQVYIEGLILETTANRTREFGTEILGAYGSGNASRAGFTSGPNGSLNQVLANQQPSNPGFFAGAVAGKTKTLGVGDTAVRLNPLNMLIRAIASNENSNILATPQILAIDNTDAEFEVGATVPIQNTVTANTVTQTTAGQQEAKLSLKITPQINKVTRFVKLKINQTINDFTGEANPNGLGQATTTRAAVTEVIVRDKDTVAMGGLLRDKETTSFNKVPLLGDIPVLGWLFKSKGRKIEKVNLLMFMTPTILSPYDKTASANTLKVLENRIENLKNIVDDENPEPNKAAAESLRAKVELQKKGPLFDNELNEYQKTNLDIDGIGKPATDEDSQTLYQPDYQGIVNEINENNKAKQQ